MISHALIDTACRQIQDSIRAGGDKGEAICNLAEAIRDLCLLEEKRKIRMRWVESGVDPESFEYPAHLR